MLDTRIFIQNNYTSYLDDEKFLVTTTDKTKKVWNKCSDLLKEELEKHVLDIDYGMAFATTLPPGSIVS